MKKILTIFSIFCLAALIGGFASAANETPQQPPENCIDYAKAATTLGVTEDALKAAMGNPGTPKEKPDTTALATKLGVTEDALKTAMESQQGKPDNAALAAKLGISEDKVKEAMGTPGQNGTGMFTDAAKKLNITEDALKAALDGAKTC